MYTSYTYIYDDFMYLILSQGFLKNVQMQAVLFCIVLIYVSRLQLEMQMVLS